MNAMSNDEDDHSSFFESLWDNPPESLLLPAEDGAPRVSFHLSDGVWQEYRIWEGYIDASSLLLNAILEGKPNSRGLIFPAMFNLRHAMEVALKWHIKYAEGTIPKNAGHNLEILIQAFRDTASTLDEDVTYICDAYLDLILEMASLDPRAIKFRYSTEIAGSAISIPRDDWDLRRLIYSVDLITMWFDHLSGYIDMSSEEYQAMMRESDRG